METQWKRIGVNAELDKPEGYQHGANASEGSEGIDGYMYEVKIHETRACVLAVPRFHLSCFAPATATDNIILRLLIAAVKIVLNIINALYHSVGGILNIGQCICKLIWFVLEHDTKLGYSFVKSDEPKSS